MTVIYAELLPMFFLHSVPYVVENKWNNNIASFPFNFEVLEAVSVSEKHAHIKFTILQTFYFDFLKHEQILCERVSI